MKDCSKLIQLPTSPPLRLFKDWMAYGKFLEPSKKSIPTILTMHCIANKWSNTLRNSSTGITTNVVKKH